MATIVNGPAGCNQFLTNKGIKNIHYRSQLRNLNEIENVGICDTIKA